MANTTIPFPRRSFIKKGERSHRKSGDTTERRHFMINKQSAVPIHVQLKEQVRYAIMSGDYEPGSSRYTRCTVLR